MTGLAKHLNYSVLIVLLMIVGFFLRVVDIDHIPQAIYGDGLTLVYDAYSILKTGQDQKGNPYPFIFQLGDHRPPGYVYATIPFVALFGPSALAANSVSILSGVGLILLIFLLGRRLYSPRVGLAAALIWTISPWDLSLSRGPFETHFALFCTVFGVYYYFKSRDNPIFLILASLGFGVASVTYPTYGLTAPLLYLFLVFLDREWILVWARQNLKFVIVAGIISLTFAILSLSIIHSGNDPTRVESINVFSRPEISAEINGQIATDRRLDSGPEIWKNLIHNRFWAYFTLVIENYSENFRPGFILIHGDGEPRHNPAETGELYWASFLLVILGTAFLYGKRNLAILWGWLLIAPVATAFISPPHALRNSLMLPPLLLLAAFGAEKVIISRSRFKHVIQALFISLYLIEVIFVMDRFFLISPNKFANYWSYPAKQASFYALEQKQNYDYVILSSRIDNMEFAYPVYTKIEPQRVIAQNKQPGMLRGIKVLNYDNVYIGAIPEGEIKKFLDSLPGSALYIGQVKDREFVQIKDVLSGPDFKDTLVISEKR